MLEYTFSLANFEILILILVRISCFVYIAPFFGTKNAPSQAKIGFSFFVALLVYGFVDKTAIEYTGLIGYAIIVLKEGITGLLIGFAANICNSIILFAGNIKKTLFSYIITEKPLPDKRRYIAHRPFVFNKGIRHLLFSLKHS